MPKKAMRLAGHKNGEVMIWTRTQIMSLILKEGKLGASQGVGGALSNTLIRTIRPVSKISEQPYS